MHTKILLLLPLLFYYAGEYNSQFIDINLTCWGKLFIRFYMLLYIQLQLREEKCTSVFTDGVSHKTWQKNDSIIGPLTACDTGLWANFEFKIWPYSPFLEWFLSVLFLSKYVDIVYTAFQNFYTLHIPLERILYFCNYAETNLSFRKLFYLIPSLI